MRKRATTLFFSNQPKISTNVWPRLYSSIDSHPIPKLEIMNKMVERAKEHLLPSLSKIAFIGAQHKLETTATLFKAMIDLGAKPENMFFTGKCYSTCQTVEATIQRLGVKVFEDPKPCYPGGYSEACTKVIKEMWETFNAHLSKTPDIEKIVILDDGGRFTEELKFVTVISYPLVAIEQTRGGLYSKGLIDHGMFPIISVAQSAAKKIIEAPLIATAILTRLERVTNDLEINQSICGVVGNGVTGKIVANYLADIGHKVIVYDQTITAKNHKNITMANSIEEIFKTCSFIFGCTGRDITEGLDLQTIINRNQVWISGSSEDREFRSFLIANKNNMDKNIDDIICKLPCGKQITIKQEGFPFNFDKKPWNVPATDIEMTQCCLLGAVLQASVTEHTRTKYKAIEPQQLLNPYIQSFIVSSWGDREIVGEGRFEKDLIDMFKIPNWIEEKSGKGYHIDHKILKTAFQVPIDPNALPIDHSAPNMRKFMKKSPRTTI